MTTPHPSDRDIDAMFAGSTMREPEWAALQALFASMRQTLVIDPPADHVSAFAAVLSQAVIEAPMPAAARAARPSHSLRKRLVAIAVGAGISALGVAGAAAANEAAPGDPLYGVDEAFESIGILDGGTDERLTEARVLTGRGEADDAIALMVEALDADGQHEAAVALERAVAAVQSQSSGTDVRSQVADMLAWMSQQERGADFGANVSAHAREIAATAHAAAKPPADPGTQSSTPVVPGIKANPPADPGSQANPAAEPGNQANPPAEPGNQANPPAEPGNQANPPADPGHQANPPADPGNQANPPAEPGDQGNRPADAGTRPDPPVPPAAGKKP